MKLLLKILFFITVVLLIIIVGIGINSRKTPKIKSGKKACSDSKPIKIAVVGDIMLSRGLVPLIRKYGEDYPFREVSGFLKSADVVIGNLECYFSIKDYEEGSFDFRASSTSVRGLKNAGFNVITIANNHIVDTEGTELIDTIDTIKNSGIAVTGAGTDITEATEPAVIEVRGKKIAVLACNTVSKKGYATDTSSGVAGARGIIDKIKECKVFYDYIIVGCHWGDEESDKLTGFQREFAHKLIDAGCELVIGHHPHVIQPMEIYKGRLIVYSLANFIFDNPKDETSKSFIFLTELFERSKKYKIFPIKRKYGVAKFANASESGSIIDNIEKLSSGRAIALIKDKNYRFTEIIYPNTGRYIEVSRSSKELKLYHNFMEYRKFKVAVGYDGATPKGRYIILNKYIYKEPHEDLGVAWMGLDRWNLRTKRQYGIHGSNDDSRIGNEISKGCVELNNRDVIELYKLIDVGMEVFIID